MTETPILNESAVNEIEARARKYKQLAERAATPADEDVIRWFAKTVRALCATVKHLRANPRQVWDEHPNRDGSGKQCTDCGFDNRFHAYECFFLHPSLKISEEAFNALHDEKTRLQSQLEQLRAEQDYWRTRADEASKAAEKWYHERY